MQCAQVGQEASKKQTELLASLELPESTLSNEQYDQLNALLKEYSDDFVMSKSELGCCDLVQHEIDTDGIKLQPYHLPVIKGEKVAQMNQEMKEQGVVKPSGEPDCPCPKKGLQSTLLYRLLVTHSITKKDVYPLPRIEDILVTLEKAKYFSTLHLAAGY